MDNREVAIPHGGLETNATTEASISLSSSPSHAVGLERDYYYRSCGWGVQGKSPSHMVGLELLFSLFLL